MTGVLDISTAYAAMYEFLEAYYERTHSDDIGSLLSSMSILEDGGTADPAMWQDWMDSIEKSRIMKIDLSLGLK